MILMLAARITLPHFSVSLVISFPNRRASAKRHAIVVSKPGLHDRTSEAALISLLSLSMISPAYSWAHRCHTRTHVVAWHKFGHRRDVGQKLRASCARTATRAACRCARARSIRPHCRIDLDLSTKQIGNRQ